MAQPVRLIRRVLPLMTVAVVAAVVYDGWIFYSRWKSVRDGERAEKEEEVRRAQQTIDMIGGTGFRIVNFYASPQVVRRGAKAEICFGVYGAKRVRIEPPVEDLKPAMSYCFEVAPRKSTEYKLTAEDGAGHSAGASLEIKVTP